MRPSERAFFARKRRFSGVLALSLLSSVSIAGKAWARKPIHSPDVSQAMCAVDYNVSGNIGYRGGAVVANVEAIPVFWSASVDPSIQAWAQGYLATLTNSAYMDLLAEYSTVGQARGTGQTIGRGTAGPAVVITPTVRGTTISDSNGQIATELEAQITAGHLPAPSKDAQGNSNTIYVVFFPPGTVVNDGTGNSCAAFCAYHGSGGRNNDILYAVIPDMGPGSACNKGCSDACTTDDVGVSIGSVSHELAEAISDPVNAWFNPTSRNGSEIGDICSSTSGMQTDTGIVPGTNIKAQYEWSQRNQRCLLAPIGYDGGTPPPVDAGGVTRDAGAQPDAHLADAAAHPDASSPIDGGGAPTGAGGSGVGSGGSNGGSAGGTGGGTTGSAGGGPGVGGSAGNGSGTTGVGGMTGTGGGPASGAGGGAQGGTHAGGSAGSVIGGRGGSSDRPPPPPASDSAGCSCSFEHSPRGSWWALSGLLLLAARRRRRR